MTKVIFCTCGDALIDKIDYKALADYAHNIDGVKETVTMKALCTKGDKDTLVKAVKGAEKLVVFACTRSVCGKPIETAMKEAGLPEIGRAHV